LLAATILTALWLYLGAPSLAHTPGWFYQAVNKGSFDMLLVAAAAALLPMLVRGSFRWARARPWAAGMCLVAGSIALQVATGLIARRGIHGWTERFYVGHGEFTAISRFVPDPLSLLRNYEDLAARNQLGLYGPSKPPGTYAVYLAINASSHSSTVQSLVAPLARIVALDPDIQPADRVLVAWTILFLGLCAAFTTLPLFWLGRILFAGNADSARVYTYPAWLFATSPVINVITVHLDSTLFPLLSATSVAFSACAAQLATGPEGLAAESGGLQQQSAAVGMAGGLLGMAAVYCSYGNLPILAMDVAIILALLFQQRSEAGLKLRRLQAYWPPLAGLLTGAGAMLLLLHVALDWQPYAGYLRGLGYHQAWRPNLPSAWRHGLAFIEFGLFAGPPLMLAFLASSAQSILGVVRSAQGYWHTRVHQPQPYGIVVLTLVTTLIIGTINVAMGSPEAARLWLFMLPWVCCAATAMFTRLDHELAFVALLVGQVVLTFFVKNYLVW
jgi:hypothetical protein